MYPLGRIRVTVQPAGYDQPPHEQTVRLHRAERARLRHRYGPCPYGPLPDDE